jgi:phosphoglycolate phosphatase
MIKNIIFDWSGVIKDSIEDHLFVVNEIFTKFGVNKISLTELKENWEQPYMLFYNKYLPNLTLEQEMAAYKEAIMKSPPPRFYAGIVDLIKGLKQQGIRMVVVSSDLSETLLSEIDSFGLNDIFLDVVTEVHDKTAAMECLIKKHSFDKSETFVVGDSNHEIEAGKHIGIKTVAVTWGFTLEDRLIASNPNFIAHNLDELREFCG